MFLGSRNMRKENMSLCFNRLFTFPFRDGGCFISLNKKTPLLCLMWSQAAPWIRRKVSMEMKTRLLKVWRESGTPQTNCVSCGEHKGVCVHISSWGAVAASKELVDDDSTCSCSLWSKGILFKWLEHPHEHVQIRHRLGRICREATLQAELQTESVKLAHFSCLIKGAIRWSCLW